MPEIERFRADESAESILHALYENGVAIVERLLPDPLLDDLAAQLDGELEDRDIGGGKIFLAAGAGASAGFWARCRRLPR